MLDWINNDNIGLSFYIIITQYLTLCFQETFKPWASSNWPKTTLFSWVYWIDPGLYIHHFQTQIIQIPLLVPSGKHTKNYGKSPCSMRKSTISMVIFNSCVKLPEGIGSVMLIHLNTSYIICFYYYTNYSCYNQS